MLTREMKKAGEKYTIEIMADRIFISGRRYVAEGKGKRMAHRKDAIRFLLRMMTENRTRGGRRLEGAAKMIYACVKDSSNKEGLNAYFLRCDVNLYQ